MSRPKRVIRINDDGTAEIPAKNGLYALIDASDVSKAKKYGWVLKDSDPNHLYFHARKGNTTILLHRYLMNAKSGEIVDHIDGNQLDNRRVNLRLVSAQQNNANRQKQASLGRKYTSAYKGVHKRENGKFRAAIRIDKKLINLGTFASEKEAAMMYNQAASIYFGIYARLNKI